MQYLYPIIKIYYDWSYVKNIYLYIYAESDSLEYTARLVDQIQELPWNYHKQIQTHASSGTVCSNLHLEMEPSLPWYPPCLLRQTWNNPLYSHRSRLLSKFASMFKTGLALKCLNSLAFDFDALTNLNFFSHIDMYLNVNRKIGKKFPEKVLIFCTKKVLWKKVLLLKSLQK